MSGNGKPQVPKETAESPQSKVSFQIPAAQPKGPAEGSYWANRRIATDLGKTITTKVAKKKQIDLATGRFINRQQNVELIRGKDAKSRHFRIRSSVATTQLDEDPKLKFLILDSTQLTTWTADYLRWTFQTSFLNLFLSVYGLFVILIVGFALVIHGVAYYQPACVFGEGYDHLLMDSIHLSWTTLSTVGYGVTSPQLSQDRAGCILINGFMAYEAFLGVLVGSVTGAVIFGKIARNQTIGAVNFSNPVCVVYGDGVHALNNKEIEDDSDSDDDEDGIPCPVMLFRISNQLDNIRGGALVDASVSVVATTPVEKSCHTCGDKRFNADMIHFDENAFSESMGKTSRRVPLSAWKATRKTVTRPARTTGNLIQMVHQSIVKPVMFPFTTEEEEEQPYSSTDKDIEKEIEKLMTLKANREAERLNVNANAMLVDEGDSTLVPARLFHHLKLETNTHPFFKRTWIIRHDLNEESPLLSEEARVRIQENNGCWPRDWNNHESVRKHFLANMLIVSVSGTNRGSGSTVYAHKVYKDGFLKIGYDFAPMQHVNKTTGEISVDQSLLSDVLEQQGGGGEPLFVSENERPPIVSATSTYRGAMIPLTSSFVSSTGDASGSFCDAN